MIRAADFRIDNDREGLQWLQPESGRARVEMVLLGSRDLVRENIGRLGFDRLNAPA